MSDLFYEELKAFSNFNDTFIENNYTHAPKDWFVIITDIKNSTIAVDSGKYKDVNLIGSACIGAITSIGQFPFVFGGDGASFLVSPSKLPEIQKQLLKIQNSAKNRYSLELRIGIVPVKDILGDKEIKVAKFQLAKGQYIAKFSGGGLEFADRLIKEDSSYLLSSPDNEESSFDGISCRWNPIKSSQGVILTLIIKAQSFDQYKNIQDQIDKTIGNDLSKINPVKPNDMSYMSLSEIYKNESNYESHFFSLSSLKRKIEIFMAFLIFKTFRRFQPSFIKSYSKSMVTHSDFRKFDDVLRMVIDCSKQQMDKIISILDKTSNLEYGHTCSEHALMTCLVFGMDEGEHIHFIDGAGGGYTKAAKMLKAKLKNKY